MEDSIAAEVAYIGCCTWRNKAKTGPEASPPWELAKVDTNDAVENYAPPSGSNGFGWNQFSDWTSGSLHRGILTYSYWELREKHVTREVIDSTGGATAVDWLGDVPAKVLPPFVFLTMGFTEVCCPSY